MTTVAHGGLVAKQVVGGPRHDVRLPRGHLGATLRAAVGLFGSVRRDIADEPFPAAHELFTGTTVRKTRYVTLR
ncbi:hypothetical protein [Leucobacter komagatae]|uniref:hypothetical protein n=1 Tax=Leucobacter komagatae TaxID=55969 RepID=UPI0014772215|nr:hypothetical protein [Leucobacter komagatae]